MGGCFPAPPEPSKLWDPPKMGVLKLFWAAVGGSSAGEGLRGGAPTQHRGTAWGFFEMGTFPSRDFPWPNYGNF